MRLLLLPLFSEPRGVQGFAREVEGNQKSTGNKEQLYEVEESHSDSAGKVEGSTGKGAIQAGGGEGGEMPGSGQGQASEEHLECTSEQLY